MKLPADIAYDIAYGRKRQCIQPGRLTRPRIGAIRHVVAVVKTVTDHGDGTTTEHELENPILDNHDEPLAVRVTHVARSEDGDWILTVEPYVAPRLLAPAGRPAGTELGYTANRFQAMPDEPEAIDAATLDPHWTQDAQVRHAEAERAGTPGQRLDRALAEAKANGVNTSYLEAALEQRLRAIQRAARKDVA